MARKKPARPAKKAKKQAKKKTASKAAARKGMKKPAKKAAKKKAAKKKASKPAKRAAAKKAAPRKAAPASAKATAGKPKKAVAAKKPNLDRPRKTVADIHGIPSSLDANRGPSAAKSGRAEMKDRMSKNTGSGPAITAGDVDADWESAESVGDEAPGGDNPTPDQDVVDDIGRALGVEYEDDEELQGGAEIVERDTHRWELDPSSKDDFDEEK
jgi:membrane protein involved in colicin uptake